MPGPAERLFNRRLKRFRVWIEHTFGMWKKMFPIFLSALRKVKRENSQVTIISSCVLFNIARDLGEEGPDLPDSISAQQFACHCILLLCSSCIWAIFQSTNRLRECSHVR